MVRRLKASAPGFAEEFAAVNMVLGTDGFVAVDLVCKYGLDEAQRLTRILDDRQTK